MDARMSTPRRPHVRGHSLPIQPSHCFNQPDEESPRTPRVQTDGPLRLVRWAGTWASTLLGVGVSKGTP
eukprot:5874989-Pleurochrysis_carterae.AAC.1